LRAFLILALLLGAPKAPKPQKMGATIFLNRQAGMAPLMVRATVMVRDPERLLACGSIAWDWANGYLEDVPIYPCDPYAMPEDVPRYFSQTREMVYRRTGEYEIRALVHSSRSQTLGRISLTVR
jgi:hypothetical protein